MLCEKKKKNSIFTFFGMLLELLSLWSHREDRTSPEREKHGHAAAPVSGATNGAANGAPAAAGAGSAPATSTV